MKVTTLILKRGDRAECILCGSSKNLTIDHITSQFKNGTNRLENYMILCVTCNQMKGSFSLKEFWEHLKIIEPVLRKMNEC